MNEEMPISPRRRYHWVKKLVFLIVIVIALVAWCYGPTIWMKTHAKGYQSVFLTNGQVYFGKISLSGRFIKLTDIYYLQLTQAQGTDQDQLKQTSQKPQLVKLGNELHGPEDAMYIDKDKVLFWENMKDDSQVVKAILESKR